MIDNMFAGITIIHTIKEKPQENYLNVYPNPSSSIVHIEARKIQGYHIIELMQLINSTGMSSFRNGEMRPLNFGLIRANLPMENIFWK